MGNFDPTDRSHRFHGGACTCPACVPSLWELGVKGGSQRAFTVNCHRCGKEMLAEMPKGSAVFYCSLKCAD